MVVDHHGGKIATGLFALVVIWIIVFWLWQPAEPGISFGEDGRGNEATRATAIVDPVPEGGVPTRPVLTDPIVEIPPKVDRVRPPPPVPLTQGVLAPEFTEYTVQRGDTFASIARRFFGSSGRADWIARANPLVDPTRLSAGRVLRIPRDPANIQGKPIATPQPGPTTSSGERVHTVERGDTLTGISRKYYGTIKNFDLILRANRNVLSKPEDLRPGQTLVIPPSP